MSKSGVADNNKELMDVVDDYDNVIGQMTKGEVHKGKNILHREVGVIIYDSNNNILLQQRSFKKKVCPGRWSPSAVGHVLSGQTPEEAAHMELKEELGFDTDLKLVEKRKFIIGNNSALACIFIGKFPRGVSIIPDKDELEKAGFFSVENVKKMIQDGVIDKYSAETLQKFISGNYLI